MNILITGDFYIADAYSNQSMVDKSVEDLFHQADYRIVNLEAPLTVEAPENKIFKTGPHLRMSAETAMPYLKQLKVDGVTLANNHILDFGITGLLDTFEVLTQNDIAYVGAGKNLNDAAQALTLEQADFQIAILNFCENEWSIAEHNSPGANPIEIIDNTNQIKAAKITHDKVICIIHGGHEYYHLPSPRMVKQYRFYVDNGADAVVGHHTHCIGGYETYNDAPIIYSLGNFIFTKPNDNFEWNDGLITNLKICKDTPITFQLTHTTTDRETFYLKINDKTNNKKGQVEYLCTIIQDNQKLSDAWEHYTKEKKAGVITSLSPVHTIKNRYLRYLLKKFIFNKLYGRQKFLRRLFNQIRCEAHYDLTKNTLKFYHGTKHD